MESQELAVVLQTEAAAAGWLRPLGIVDARRGYANLVELSNSRLSPDLLAVLLTQLQQRLPEVADPDLALETLQRFVNASLNPLALGCLFEREPEGLDALLRMFAASGHLGEMLVQDPAAFELLRLTSGQPVDGGRLRDELRAEVGKLPDDRSVVAALRRYKRRETLRIAYGDLIGNQPVITVCEQLSFLADAMCEAALNCVRRQLIASHGTPLQADGRPARFAILGVTELGGREMSYDPHIDLFFLCDGSGKTAGKRPITNIDLFDKLAKEFLSLMQDETELGFCYCVSNKLQPPSSSHSCVVRRQDALHHYDVLGRTQERQTLIKARTIAGDRDLGDEFLEALEPWIYRRYLSRVDITEIKALKRRIERRALREGVDKRDLETGQGGIRDIQHVVQFLQLLNGCDLPPVRTGNTLEAIQSLHATGCLDGSEESRLTEGYTHLRRLQHRLQLRSLGLSTTLPCDDDELTRLAISMGNRDRAADAVSGESLAQEFEQVRTQNQAVLKHLMEDAFSDTREEVEPETDLVLDPDPREEFVHATLAPYRFVDVDDAYRNLVELSTERIRFLSTRRCRHFFSAIAAPLLQAIRNTPDPDDALSSLCRVSDSLGGKGVLWELFQVNPATLQLYVRLCASSHYLSNILTSHPGMLDELMDSLILDRLPTRELLSQTLADWCRSVSDVAPTLHNFKNTQHLNAGVRDVLGKEHIRQTTAFLADVAEVCIQRVCDMQMAAQVQRYGEPWNEQTDRRCELIVLALGKLGGREPNYHSDLDVVFLYEAEGTTRDPRNGRVSDRSTSHRHFFGELAQRIAKFVNQFGPHGRLYELDTKLRPSSPPTQLATSVTAFSDDFADHSRDLLLERMALCRARIIYGSASAQQALQPRLIGLLQTPRWQSSNISRVREYRKTLEAGASRRNLKRSAGGLVDIDLLVQSFQLMHAASSPQILGLGTFDGLAALREESLISATDAQQLTDSYTYLRGVEARLRLMNTAARHDLPSQPHELAKLAYLMGTDNEGPAEKSIETMRGVRRIFNRLLDAT